MVKTEDALKEAFAGESQANRKYLAFAAKAAQEGFAQSAKLFQTIHAHAHLRALKGIRSTKENLQKAIDGETHEFKSMYPAMIETAKAEGYKEQDRSMGTLAACCVKGTLCPVMTKQFDIRMCFK